MLASPKSKAPITRLSHDVLQYIFEVGTWDTREMDDSRAFPWLISHVSRDWRRLALAMPTLWTLITMRDNLKSPNYFRDRHNLTRSQQCPLTVYIDLRIPGWEHIIDGSVHPFTESVVQRMFWVLSEHMQRPISMFQLQPSTRLEHFEVERDPHSSSLDLGDQPTDVEAPVALDTDSASALKSLSLTGTHIDWTQFSFANLSRLTIAYLPINMRPSVEILCSTIGKCANRLEYLKFYGAAPVAETAEGDVDPSHSITLPHVQEFVLGYVHPSEMVLLAKLFIFPAVKKLMICDIGRALMTADHRARFPLDGSIDLEALLLGTGIVSMSSVQELAIEGLQLPASPTLALKFLNSFPRLGSLVLHDASPTFVDALAVAPRSDSSTSDSESLPSLTCPLLRDLKLVDMNVAALDAILTTRRSLATLNAEVSARLASISVYGKAFRDEDMRQVAKDTFLSHADTVVLGEHYQPEPSLHEYAAWEIPRYSHATDDVAIEDGDLSIMGEQPLPVLTGALA
ncbi:hypothetical protein EVG20_g5776 [Dentipellis fragilis]|uniref:F-box domain-containing protein n=1 Tax=Dentipellis fragilis TaxID=205917 RepID=A0A4Y9YR82_9AGAM|nr:hypothetical protein EVG20_g5776 [Dentipellis fragilis]